MRMIHDLKPTTVILYLFGLTSSVTPVATWFIKAQDNTLRCGWWCRVRNSTSYLLGLFKKKDKYKEKIKK
jgi:hypothetical protein